MSFSQVFIREVEKKVRFAIGGIYLDYSHKPAIGRPENIIADYIARSQGLELRPKSVEPIMAIFQRVDGKTIRFSAEAIEEVLERQDSDGQAFLQVNFIDGKKILITDRLIGFKPAETAGLDLKKLPKVVTTPDLVSVVEAIEESLTAKGTSNEEVDVLRRVFDSVLNGAEAVGFELDNEKSWLNPITGMKQKASA